MNKKKLISSLLALVFVLGLFLCNTVLDKFLPESGDTGFTQESTAAELPSSTGSETDPAAQYTLDENGHYNSKEDVALYIHLYGHLPENYITKSQCSDLGYSNSDAEKAVPDGAIGGDKFGNREGLLPKKDGRTWTECDIDTWGKSSRGAKRIVFSNDGLVYYTDDHYESFELLYGEP